ncbi:hypothetical protein [Cesiribacter sp. SM1]|uniref:hypothetical protein n=1 Tax=Cesiribacter sp. SM1 TaxID=2861196 RepID=UPI001CD6F447|nr:hypothetical protein [Cesiribacter sp. SM1]
MMLDIVTKDAVMDTAKAKELLNYKPLTEFGAAVEALTDWVRRFGSKKDYLNNLSEAPWRFIEN